MTSTNTDKVVPQFVSPDPCGRCTDTYRFADGNDSVCSTCGLTRFDVIRKES